MGIERSGFDRLLAGEVEADDPALGRTAEFLGQLQATQELPSVTDIEQQHLALILASARPALSSPRAQRRTWAARHPRRLMVGALAGVVLGLTAGVSVAAAFGVNPLGSLISLPLTPTGSRSSDLSDSTASPSASSASRNQSDPSPTAVPTSSQSAKPSASAPNAEDSPSIKDPGNGRSHSPTPKAKVTKAPGQAKDKDKVKDKDKASGKATKTPKAKPTPASTKAADRAKD